MDEPAEFARLVDGLRTGDPAAVEELCRKYGPFLQAAVRRQLHPKLRSRFDSLDFVQDVWASFLALPTGRYAFASPQALLTFLTRLAERRVTEVFRSRFETERNDVAREVPTGGEDQAPNRIPSPTGTPSQWVIAGEEWERIVSRFPPGHRAILERLREGYTLDDIARMANVSRSTVDRIVRRLKDLTKC